MVKLIILALLVGGLAALGALRRGAPNVEAAAIFGLVAVAAAASMAAVTGLWRLIKRAAGIKAATVARGAGRAVGAVQSRASELKAAFRDGQKGS